MAVVVVLSNGSRLVMYGNPPTKVSSGSLELQVDGATGNDAAAAMDQLNASIVGQYPGGTGQKPSVTAAAWDPVTGWVVARTNPGGGQGCAEAACVGRLIDLGSNPADIQILAPASRAGYDGNPTPIDPCPACQAAFPGQFYTSGGIPWEQ